MPGSDSSTSSSTSATTPSATENLGACLSFSTAVLFFGGVPCAFQVLQFRAAIALFFLQ
jgi:hypothetical protein